jgi:hypothetical protein
LMPIRPWMCRLLSTTKPAMSGNDETVRSLILFGIEKYSNSFFFGL